MNEFSENGSKTCRFTVCTEQVLKIFCWGDQGYLQIVVSLFVAVILDNLELDEDIKKLKQVCTCSWGIISVERYNRGGVINSY